MIPFIWHCMTMITAGFTPSVYRRDWLEFWYSGEADSTLVKYTWGDWVLDWNYDSHHETENNLHYYHQFNPVTKKWDFVYCPPLSHPLSDSYDAIEF